MNEALIEGRRVSPIVELLDFSGLPFDLPAAELADKLFFADEWGFDDGDNYVTSLVLVAPPAAYLSLPGIDVFAIRIGEAESWNAVEVEAVLGQDFSIRFDGISLGLQLRTEFLKPVGEFPSREPTEGFVEIEFIGSIAASYEDNRFDVEASLERGASLERTLIGDTGLIVSASGLSIGRVGESSGFSAEQAVIELPPDIGGLPDLSLREFSISSSGISGSLTAQWDAGTINVGGKEIIDENSSEAVGTLFDDGFKIALRSVSIALVENSLVDFSISCLLQFPEEVFGRTVEASIRVDGDGNFEVAIDSSAGLITLEKDDFLRVEVLSILFRSTAEETAVAIDGSIELLGGEIAKYVPKLEVKGFTVFKPPAGSWDFRIEEATADVNKSINLFDVARVDIEEIGLASRDNCNSLIFSGGVHILEGLDVAAWVEGLRVPLCTGSSLKIDGIGLRAVVPGSFEFEGYAVRREEGDTSYFEGGIDLLVIPVKLGLAASLRVGRNRDCRFAFLSAELTLPAPGIPLLSLPLYIGKIKGLVGVNMALDADSLFDLVPLLEREPVGLSDVSKWRDECGSHAVGFGVGISTADRKLFNAEALLAFTYPELLLFIEGKAFLLRTPKPGKKPPFTCLIALDLDEPATLINIGAQFEFIKGVLSADAVVEAYVGPNPDPNRNGMLAYFALGKDDPFFSVSRRISAKVLQLFTASSFLYIGTNAFALVFEIGFPKKTYGFSFASVHFEALIKGGGILYFDPAQFQGDFLMTGSVGFRIFRIGFNLSLGASVLGRTPDWLVDAEIWFGVKFKIIFKTIRIGATIPFRWEKRTVPPIPEILNELLLKDPILDSTQAPLIVTSNCQLPTADIVPEAEPGAAPVLTFRYATADRTGLPFGQDVGVIGPHESDDYLFHPMLLDIELSRMTISDWKDRPQEERWEEFDVQYGEGGFFAYRRSENPGPMLYGAWQATEDADGTPRATELHLFARSPFDYARNVHYAISDTARFHDSNVVAVGGRLAETVSAASQASILAEIASSRLNADGVRLEEVSGQEGEPVQAAAAIDVPYVAPVLKNEEDLSSQDGPLPNRPLQQLVNEGRLDLGYMRYPRSGVRAFADSGEPEPLEISIRRVCANFLDSQARGWPADEIFGLDSEAVADDGETPGELLIGGDINGIVQGSVSPRRVGNLEIVRDDTSAYPLQYLEAHVGLGFVAGTANGVPIVERKTISRTKDGRLKLLFREPVSKLTIHFETLSNGLPLATHEEAVTGVRCGPTTRMRATSAQPLPNHGLTVRGTYRRDYTKDDFWTNGTQVRSVEADSTAYGKITLTSNEDYFNEVEFEVRTGVRIYSLCYEIDGSSELADKNRALEEYIGIGWPGSDADSGDDDWPVAPGPSPNYGLRMITPEGGIEPGYLYRLTVKTSNRRSGRKDAGPIENTYCAYFSVPRPPSRLGPYIVETRPGQKFPSYRSLPYYLRTGKNFVHKLMGDQNDSITMDLGVEGDVIASLPYRDWPYQSLSEFSADKSDERFGWGWGKAGDGHRETTDEEIWREAFNSSLPQSATPIDANMALPDDVLWAYPVNPVLLRTEFDTSTEGIAGYLEPIDAAGTPVTGRWQVDGAQLAHNAETDASVEPSFLLSNEVIDGSFVLSVWLRPSESGEDPGEPAIVLAANKEGDGSLARYVAVRLSPATGRIALVQMSNTAEPVVRTMIERRFELPRSRWTKLVVRVVERDGGVAISAENSDTVLLTAVADLPSASGRVGFMVSPQYSGRFDNLEVLSLSRLEQLPRPGMNHKVTIRFRDAAKQYDMFGLDFRSSRYLDLFDHINAWDRSVWRAGETSSTSESTMPLIDQWTTANTAYLAALAELARREREAAMRRASLENVEEAQKLLREARFNLDTAFEAIAQHLGFSLAPQPDQFEFFVAANGLGLLLQSPEPIEWTTIGAGPIESDGSSTTSESESTTRFVYSSDLTRAILCIESAQQTLGTFEPGGRYVWTLTEFRNIPQHLSWLRGWVEHLQRDHLITLEIPQVE